MAFRALLDGADCGGSNPLLKLANQQMQHDRVPFRDAFFGESSRQGPMSREHAPLSGRDQQMVDEFFESSSKGKGKAAAGFGPGMDAIEANLHGMRLAEHPPMAGSSGGWVDDFQLYAGPPRGRMMEHPQHHLSDLERADFEKIYELHDPAHHKDWNQEYLNSEVAIRHPEIDGETFKDFNQTFDSIALEEQNSKNWEKEFASALEAKAWEKKDMSDDIKFDVDDYLSRLDDPMALEAEKADFEYYQQFDEIWKRATAHDETFEPYGASLQKKEYTFEKVNPYLSHESPFEEGIAIMEHGKEGSNLIMAVLAFEAAVQKNPEDASAWFWLGKCQAENEKEDFGMIALQKAVQLDGNQTEARMNLAIAYTNEGYEYYALDQLVQWIKIKHPNRFPDSFNEKRSMVGYTREEVMKMFLGIIAEDARLNKVDADLQVGLGILYYSDSQLDKAVDCFSAAVNLRPKDYTLWNRLGATLSNDGRSEEAIQAYSAALSIKPSYVRSRYNLGISCLNIGCFKEAIEHYLGAIQDSHRGGGLDINVSTNLWDSLRRALIRIGRNDLAEIANESLENLDVFRADFDF